MSLKTNYILLCFLLGFWATNAQYSLNYNLKIGDSYKIEQVANQEIIQNMNGSEHRMHNLIEGTFIFKVEHINDSIITFDFAFDRFKMSSTSSMMGELMNVDTNDSIALDDVEGKLFSGLTTSSLKMLMLKNGDIKEIYGTGTMVDHMIESAGDFNDFTKDLMKEAMKKEFGGKNLSESFEQLTFIYPDTKVKKGEIWQTEYKGKVSAINNWTLDKISKELLRITGQSDVNYKTNDESLTMDLSGKTESEIVAFRPSGFIKSMTSISNAKGTSVIKNMEGLEVPTTMTTKITYKVTKDVQ